MHPAFVSAWQRLLWSDEHFDSLRSDLMAFDKGKPYKAVDHHSDDFTEHRVCVEVDDPEVIGRWGLIFGDCIHNMRSALDHAIYGIAVYQGGVDPPRRHRTLMFPILKCAADFNQQGEWRIENLSDLVQGVVRVSQPYKRLGQPVDRAFLGRFNEFDVSDKHRLIRLATMRLDVAKMDIEGMYPGLTMDFHSSDGPLELGEPFFTISFREPVAPVTIEKATVTVRISLESRFGDNPDPE